MARKRTFKSSTQRSSMVAPGAKSSAGKAAYMQRQQATINQKSGGAGTSRQTSGARQNIGAAAYQTASSQGPTYRSSYVTYNSEESSRPTVPTVAGTVISAATPNQSPLPQGKGELVFAVGTGLILLSGFTSKHIQAVLDLFLNAKNMKYTRQQARVGMVVVGGEFLFLMILTAFSEQSEDFSNVSLALLFVLFLVWGIGNVNTSNKWVDFITGKAKNI